jgi:predicted nucleic acid-binding protein
MVLVDTSVWVRALGRTAQAATVRATLDRVLEEPAVGAHPLFYGGFLKGDVGGRAAALRIYETFPSCLLVAHDAVVAFVRHHRLMGRGVGWIDGHLLAAAVRDRVALWTVDAPLEAAAQTLGCGFVAP